MKHLIPAIIVVIVIIGAVVLYSSGMLFYDWRSDGIQLMQHETEGTYGCFGCNAPVGGPGFCVDPVSAMKAVEETPERYCNLNFEVVEI
jgi:hypothetical protein